MLACGFGGYQLYVGFCPFPCGPRKWAQLPLSLEDQGGELQGLGTGSFWPFIWGSPASHLKDEVWTGRLMGMWPGQSQSSASVYCSVAAVLKSDYF